MEVGADPGVTFLKAHFSMTHIGPYISLYIPIYPYISLYIPIYIIIISQCIPKLRTRSLKTIEVRHSYAVVVRLLMPPGALQLHSAADQLR